MMRAESVIFYIGLLCVWITCAEAIKSRFDCPGQGYDSNGYWYVDEKQGPRCILRCNDGYQASGCHVLRPTIDGWNQARPECKEASLLSGESLLIAAGAGAAAVAGAPLVLGAAGFTATGVAAGSLAAFIQTPFTAAGSWFAVAQSAGAAGIAASTKAGIGTAVGGATYAVWSYFSGCEAE